MIFNGYLTFSSIVQYCRTFTLILNFHLFIYFKDFIYFLREGREGEREGEKHQCVVASHVAPTGDLAHNSGMCPDWESNWRPFGSQPMLNP